ncbi:MAG TPA: bifunctional glutamate N-acetyltransferase/amino-acid acetyltransferase ArgJ [Actinomycetota bacterium]|nr:bifunctional glutamate N-acetyltransferase/amino-acid acetyltransferase ArgJ [Actinomycetota bacterium]
MKLPEGFTASGVACGLKPSGNLDLGMVVSDPPAVAAGVFTTNRVQAAPVQLTRRHIRRGKARAIVVNAGNANACTGKQGYTDARSMAEQAARALGVKKEAVLVNSTGIIGVPLDMTKVREGLEAANKALSPDGAGDFAAAIMTTDTRPKTAEAVLGTASILGFAKGAGMIAPEMATLLAFIVTDAPVEHGFLVETLRETTAGSFNAISVDGCRSTNDTLLVLANGTAGGEPIGAEHAQAGAFKEALNEVCGSLARQIVQDGEGATKVVSIVVEGATSAREARRAAGTVADSVLLRCALNGADPNWGRVLAALGTSGIPFDPNIVDVWLGGQLLCANGAPGPGDPQKARAALLDRDVEVKIAMKRGDATATILTNDLSAEYVRINAEYTT